MKKNLSLIVGISLPFVLILIIMAVVFLPRLALHPTYDFVYAVTSNEYQECPQPAGALPRTYPCKNSIYMVKDGKVALVDGPSSYSYTTQRLYRYDAGRDSSHEVSFDDVAKETLNNDSRSPDGFTLEHNYGNSGIFELFGGGYDNNQWVLKKGVASKPISLSTPENYYYGSNDMRFLGWVTTQ